MLVYRVGGKPSSPTPWGLGRDRRLRWEIATVSPPLSVLEELQAVVTRTNPLVDYIVKWYNTMLSYQ